ncbi:MAG: hypothetical protein WCT32_04360 [Patescibacteria group bacterium]|jgi:hypothetical protein
MTIGKLLKTGREIWEDEKMTLPQIIVRLGKIFGDICRWERNASKDGSVHTDAELQKELGNIIFSSIRCSGNLGYDPKECIRLAIENQRRGFAELQKLR